AASRRPAAWSRRRCSSASPSPRRSRSSGSCSPSSSRVRSPHMRIRTLVVASVLGLATLVAAGAPAFAQETPAPGATTEQTTSHPRGKAEEECIKLLEEGKKIDDCQEAPSPILPERNELIWASISFLVLVLLLWKFAWPGLKKGMESRTERIRADLQAAETAKVDAERVLDEYKAQLQGAREEAARIIEEARQQADALRKEQEQRLQAELAAMRERAVADLRGEVASLAIGAAEVIVQRNLDRETQVQLVENYINQVASRSN